MPPARMATYSKGVQIYLAPTADGRDSWQATRRHISCEGRCFVLGCNQFFTRDHYPRELESLEELEGQPQILSRGGSTIISPFGEELAGPLYNEEGMLTAAIDLDEIVRSHLDFDAVGHYARPDVFQLIVNEEPMRPVVTLGKDKGD